MHVAASAPHKAARAGQTLRYGYHLHTMYITYEIEWYHNICEWSHPYISNYIFRRAEFNPFGNQYVHTMKQAAEAAWTTAVAAGSSSRE